MEGFRLEAAVQVEPALIARTDSDFIRLLGAQLSELCQDLLERAMERRRELFDAAVAEAAQLTVYDEQLLLEAGGDGP